MRSLVFISLSGNSFSWNILFSQPLVFLDYKVSQLIESTALPKIKKIAVDSISTAISTPQ